MLHPARSLRFLMPLGIALATPAFGQDAGPDGPAAPDPAAEADAAALRINQVSVYGDDACPEGQGDEIVVCRRYGEDERYRIPQELRTNPNDTSRESWTARVIALERVGRTGTDSCSPVGGGGMTGCTQQLINNYVAERRASRNGDWEDAVAAARRERMDGFDAEARAVEEQVTRDEQARVAREAAADSAPTGGAAAPGQPVTNPEAEPLPTPPSSGSPG